MKLLKKLIGIPAVSGDEERMRNFLIEHYSQKKKLRKKTELFYGEDFQDNLIVKVGNKPRVALFVHIDTTGYTLGYNNQLIPIGSPAYTEGDKLVGKDRKGSVCGMIKPEDNKLNSLDFFREVAPGTLLSYFPKYREDDEYVRAPYIDNRFGIYAALKLSKLATNFVIAFTCFEEHGFGGAQLCGKYIYEKFGISKSLILDGTWHTENVRQGKGPAVSMRDRGIPRRKYLNTILSNLKNADLHYQIEVEQSGGSDGLALQKTPYPIDWCFIGPPVKNPHSATEIINKSDIKHTIEVYEYLISVL